MLVSLLINVLLRLRIEEQNRVKHVTLENLFDTMADRDVRELNLIIRLTFRAPSRLSRTRWIGPSFVSAPSTPLLVALPRQTLFADASNAIIIGVRQMQRLSAERVGVEIQNDIAIIYKAIEEIDAARDSVAAN